MGNTFIAIRSNSKLEMFPGSLQTNSTVLIVLFAAPIRDYCAKTPI